MLRVSTSPCSVELRRLAARSTRARAAAGRNDPALLGEHAPPEVRGVELDAPDLLVDGAELGQREGRADERRRDAGQAQVGANPLERVSQDPRVVECELDRPVQGARDRDESGGGRVGSTLDPLHAAEDGEVRDRDHVHARVALGVAVGAELPQQTCPVHARFLEQLARGGLVERFIRPFEAAGDRPHALEGRYAATNEQDVQALLDIVSTTTSTVTAKGGNSYGS